MKIGQRLIIGFLGIIFLTAILGGVNIGSIKNIGFETETYRTLYKPIRLDITHIRIDLGDIMRATEEHDAGWMTKEKSTEEIKEKKEKIKNHLMYLFVLSAAAGLPSPEQVEDVKSSINELYDLSAELFELHGKSREERTRAMGEFDEKAEGIDEQLDIILKEIDELSKVSLASIRDTIISSRAITISILAIIILVSLGTAFAISRSISEPIIKLKGMAVEIGKGKLDMRVAVKSKDEIGFLATSFNKMAGDLSKSRDEITAARDYADNIIKSMTDTLVVIGPEAKIKTVNKAASALLGYKEEELIDKPVATIFAAAEKILFKGTKIKKLTKEGIIRDYDTTYKTKLGEEIPVSFSGSVMRNKAGELIGIVGIARDLREFKKLQAQLFQAEKLSGIGQLGAGVAHELNSPLTGLLTLISAYRNKAGKESREHRELTEMMDATEHMANIVKDLSTFARDSKGEFTTLNLNEVIKSTLSFSARQLTAKNIKITKEYANSLLKIDGDKSQLQQVVLNMITNARDAMPNGGEFIIKTRNSESGDKVIMEFIDTGIGIKKEVLPKIFDPFFTTKGQGKGVGLGLSITHGIIKNHKGEILVESQPDKGARFTVIFPSQKGGRKDE